MASYSVGTIEAMLKGNLDDRDFKKFDAAVARAKKGTNALADSQGKAAREMRLSGKSYDQIAKKLNLTEKEVKQLIKRNEELDRSTDRGVRSNRRFSDSFGRISTTAKIAGAAIAAFAGIEIRRMVEAYRESYRVGRQTNAVIESTGGVANVTADALERYAGVLSKKTGIDDEQIQSAGNLLLTFKEIRNEAGDGNKVFDETLKLTLDLAKATGSDFTGAVKQVGKALNDPTKGLSALQRSGVSFNQTQEDTIKRLWETGDRMKAQKMILKELDSEFAGSAVAQGDPFSKLQVSIENVEEAMGEALFPLFSKVADEAEREFGRIESIISNPKLSGEEKFGRVLNVIERTLNRGIKKLEENLPEIAEMGGRLGGRLATALGRGFLNAPILGKLAIGAWLIHAFGGWGALARVGGRAGSRVATGLGMAFLRVVAPYFAAEVAANGLGSVLASKTPGLRKAGNKLGDSTGKGYGRGLLAGAGATVSIVALMAAMFTKPGQDAYKFGYRLGENIRNGITDAIKDTVGDKAGDIFDKITSPAPWLEGIVGGWNGGLVTENGIRGYARGGPVLDPRDTVPAMLAPGEFVMRKSAVDRLGIPFLSTLNQGGDVAKEAEDGKEEIVGTYKDIDRDVDKSTKKTEKTVLDRFKNIRKKTTTDQRGIQTSLRESWRKIDQDHRDRTRNMDATTRKRFGGMRETVAKRGNEMVDSMNSTMGSLTGAVLGGFGKIASQTNKALKAFGVEPVAFGIQTAEKKAQGGYLSGVGLQDTVPIWAAPGEAVVNRHQQPEIEQALALSKAFGVGSYGSLDELFSGVSTPHYMAKGGKVPGFAGGGFPELDPAARGLANQLQAMGFTPTSTYRSDSSTYHGSRDAIDYGDSINNQSKLWSILKPRARQFAELFGPSYLPGPTLMHNGVGFSDADLQAGHEDHIHVAILGALMGGLSPVEIKKQILTGPKGALKSGGQGALNKVWNAAKGYVQKNSSSGHFHGIAAGSDYQALGRQMMLRMWPASEWPALQELWTRESGWNPAARNPSSGAYGIPQALPASKMGPAAQGSGSEAAKAQIAWGLNYIKERYGSPSAALAFHNANNWYEKGGIVVKKGAPVFFRQGFDHKAAAGVFGNFYGESGWDTEAIEPGTNNGGLGGFTASPVSLPDMQAFAKRRGYDWRDSAIQSQFVALDLKRRLPSTFRKMMDADSIPATTEIFMREWERPASMSSLGKRINAGFRASRMMRAWGMGPSDPTGEGKQRGTGRSGQSSIDGRIVWMPAGGTRTGGVRPGAGRWVTIEQARKIRAQRRKERAAYRKRWNNRKRALRQGRKQTREEFRHPRFRNSLNDMPRFTDAELAETMGFHEPMAGDLFAYDRSYDMLDRIDPRLGRIQDALLGSYKMDFTVGGQSLRDRYEEIDQLNLGQRDRIGSIRRALGKQRQKSLKTGTLPGRSKSGGAAPPRKATKREIDAYFKAEIERRVKAVRAATAAKRKQVMAPVRNFRTGRREQFTELQERGELFRDIISNTRGQIAATRTAQVSQGKAFFAQGGRVPAHLSTAAGDIQITLILDDPTLAALNPQITTEVNRLGKKTQRRGRAAGGRKAVL